MRSPTLVHYDENPKGRTFIVGDLHGVFDQLLHALEQIRFNFSTDILYCTGDLIDRGPMSYNCLKLIYEPWFRSVLGNHEAMMIGTLLYSINPLYSAYSHIWHNNGGTWRNHFTETDLIPLAEYAEKTLPYMISVGQGDNQFYIVHAEVTKSTIQLFHPEPEIVKKTTIENWDFNQHDLESMLWGRRIFTAHRNRYFDRNLFQAQTVPLIYVGHTITDLPIQIERQIYIDQGGFYKTLTIAEPYANTFFLYNIEERTITTMSSKSL